MLRCFHRKPQSPEGPDTVSVWRCGGVEEHVPRRWEGERRPPGAQAQEWEWAHSGSSERLQAAGRLLDTHTQRKTSWCMFRSGRLFTVCQQPGWGIQKDKKQRSKPGRASSVLLNVLNNESQPRWTELWAPIINKPDKNKSSSKVWIVWTQVASTRDQIRCLDEIWLYCSIVWQQTNKYKKTC